MSMSIGEPKKNSNSHFLKAKKTSNQENEIFRYNFKKISMSLSYIIKPTA